MPKQQLQSISTTSSAPKLMPKPAPRVKKPTVMPASRPKKKTFSIPIDYKPKKTGDVFNDKYIKCKSGSHGKLTIEKYLETIGPYRQDMIDDLKTSGEWKIHLTTKMDFVSTTGPIKYRQMHCERDNSEIMLVLTKIKSLKNVAGLNRLCRAIK